MVAVGQTFVPVTVAVEVSLMPPSSVARMVTTKVPSSSGVNCQWAPVPFLNATPFLVTDQPYVKPAALSAALGLVADPVRWTAVPSGALDPGAVMVATGAAPFTVTGNETVEVPPLASSAVMVTVWFAGVPSSVAGAAHDQVPVLAPLLVRVPLEAVRVTALVTDQEKLVKLL